MAVTQEQKELARRLKSAYKNKKDELGLTYLSISETLNVDVSAVTQYMNGYLPINLGIVLSLADILKIDPREIDPKLESKYKVAVLNRRSRINVLGTMSGKLAKNKTVKVHGEYMASHLAIVVDNDEMEPVIDEGSTIIVDPSASVRIRDRIAVLFNDGTEGYRFYRLAERDEISITVMKIVPVSEEDAKNVKREYIPMVPMRLDINDISQIIKVVGIQF